MGPWVCPWYCHHLAGARSGTCWQAQPCPASGRLEVDRNNFLRARCQLQPTGSWGCCRLPSSLLTQKNLPSPVFRDVTMAYLGALAGS